jgi:hypothetical protein
MIVLKQSTTFFLYIIKPLCTQGLDVGSDTLFCIPELPNSNLCEESGIETENGLKHDTSTNSNILPNNSSLFFLLDTIMRALHIAQLNMNRPSIQQYKCLFLPQRKHNAPIEQIPIS